MSCLDIDPSVTLEGNSSFFKETWQMQIVLLVLRVGSELSMSKLLERLLLREVHS